MPRNPILLLSVILPLFACADLASAQNGPNDDEYYTEPIRIEGVATDQDGEPVSGATIWVTSKGVLWNSKRIAKTQTDERGKYELLIDLPVIPADTNYGRDRGSFLVFGEAEGYGFAWRPRKTFYPKPSPGTTYVDNPKRESPSRYEKGDKIELDLRFSKASALKGKVVDENGLPIAKTRVAIWDASVIPADGYGPRSEDSDRRPFPIMDGDGFELLNADVPDEMWIRHTDSEGRFVFDAVPPNCRFRVKVDPPGFPSRMVWFASSNRLKKEYEGRRVHVAEQGSLLTFEATVEVPVKVTYADSGKPAPNVFVTLSNKKGSSSKTSDSKGRVTLSIPPGEYELQTLRAIRTPYLGEETRVLIGHESPQQEIEAKVIPACRVAIRVVDAETGKGVPNVDLWRASPQETGRRDHYVTAWEFETRIVHRDRQRTDNNGTIHELFTPGKHRIGVGHRSLPRGYRVVEQDGVEVECEAGRRINIVFHLEK